MLDPSVTDQVPVLEGAARFPCTCICGLPIRMASVGRRRLSCGLSCQRHRDGIVRRITRRQSWMQLWQHAEGYSREEAAAEIRVLQGEVDALLPLLRYDPTRSMSSPEAHGAA